ncbi:MAG: hypothetical protein [Lokiarchaeia virus VerdaV1]|uniref:Uncharacterized protein n=1 Tax=Lokiarchaeia virus VerdaV1 TaxID=3070170 RepID=A0AA35CNM7_9CAUD|nr:MAG: hypothetical protein QIT41_gp13 [Lokiarchaeia virus VerdaV1]BDI54862.1 MAG: hypothetical protein [Lokiarchaeia virus VerdaV1]
MGFFREEVIEAFREEYYPVDLTLLENTSITLTELDRMDPERKMEYYFFIVEKQKEIKKEMDKDKNPEKDVYEFVSEIDIENGDIGRTKTG